MVFRTICLLGCISFALPSYSDTDSKHEWSNNTKVVDRFITLFETGTLDQRNKVMRWLNDHSGITDERIFDLVAQSLKEKYDKVPSDDRAAAREVGWLCRALASSASEKYSDIVIAASERASHTYARKYCKTASRRFGEYSKWNKAFSSVPYLSSKNSPARIEAYLELFQLDDPVIDKVIYQKIYDYSGIVDERIYDAIQKKLELFFGQKKLKRHEKDLISWQMKALSASGSDKYKPVIERVLKGRFSVLYAKVKKYAEKSLDAFDQFKAWNAVTARTDFSANERSERLTEWLNLLVFGDTAMANYSVRNAFGNEVYDDFYASHVILRVEKEYQSPNKGNYSLDFQSWACKYLAKYGSEEARVLIQKLANESPHIKVRKYAKQSLALM